MATGDLITIDKDISGEQTVFKNTHVPAESFFDHLEAGACLDAYLKDLAPVNKQRAIALLNWANKLLNKKNCTNFMRLLLDGNLSRDINLISLNMKKFIQSVIKSEWEHYH